MRKLLLKRFCNSEDGQAIAFVAITIVFLLGMTGLVTDGGQLYLAKNRLQKAADAAALAGAMELPKDLGAAESVAKETSELNGAPNTGVYFEDVKQSIKVITNKEVNLSFARLFGFEKVDVKAAAKVKIEGPATSAARLMPFGLNLDRYLAEGKKEEDIKPGKVLELLYQENQAGNFGALDYDGSGASDYGTFIEHGYPGIINVGDTFKTEPGQMKNQSAKVEQHIDEIVHIPIYNCPSCTKDESTGEVKITGKVDIKILGIIAVKITEMLQGGNGNGNKIGVRATIEQTSISGGGSPTQPDFGTYAFKLVPTDGD